MNQAMLIGAENLFQSSKRGDPPKSSVKSEVLSFGVMKNSSSEDSGKFEELLYREDSIPSTKPGGEEVGSTTTSVSEVVGQLDSYPRGENRLNIPSFVDPSGRNVGSLVITQAEPPVSQLASDGATEEVLDGDKDDAFVLENVDALLNDLIGPLGPLKSIPKIDLDLSTSKADVPSETKATQVEATETTEPRPQVSSSFKAAEGGYASSVVAENPEVPVQSQRGNSKVDGTVSMQPEGSAKRPDVATPAGPETQSTQTVASDTTQLKEVTSGVVRTLVDGKVSPETVTPHTVGPETMEPRTQVSSFFKAAGDGSASSVVAERPEVPVQSQRENPKVDGTVSMQPEGSTVPTGSPLGSVKAEVVSMEQPGTWTSSDAGFETATPKRPDVAPPAGPETQFPQTVKAAGDGSASSVVAEKPEIPVQSQRGNSKVDGTVSMQPEGSTKRPDVATLAGPETQSTQTVASETAKPGKNTSGTVRTWVDGDVAARTAEPVQRSLEEASKLKSTYSPSDMSEDAVTIATESQKPETEKTAGPNALFASSWSPEDSDRKDQLSYVKKDEENSLPTVQDEAEIAEKNSEGISKSTDKNEKEPIAQNDMNSHAKEDTGKDQGVDPSSRSAGELNGPGTSRTAVTNAQMATRNVPLPGRGPEILPQGLAQVVRQVASDGTQRASIVVDPPALGRVEVEVHVTPSGMEASFKVDSVQVRDMIKPQIPLLQDMLAQQGISASSVNVDVRQGDDRRSPWRDTIQSVKGRRGRTDEDDDVPEESIVTVARIDLELGMLQWYA
ncbi:MAG: flagellar hook-length control protein FliK [Synergistota bacterium]|nr:flagellar hook-length control protein FliK [Synergistota bacterium]